MALVRARLSLPTVRRAVSLFDGSHTSAMTGRGYDFEDLTEYRTGDQVRDIDWKVSARAGKPVIRRFERETDVLTQLLLDTGIEMNGAAPSGEPKGELALQCAETLAYLAAYRGDQLGLIQGNAAGVERFPARHGSGHLDFLLDRADRALGAARAPANVAAIADCFLRTRRERSLAILVTDEYWPTPPDELLLRRIRERHELLVVRIADMSVTAEGVEAMADISDGSFMPDLVRDDRKLREQEQQYRRERQRWASHLLARHRVLNASVASSGDIIGSIVDLLRWQHRGS